MLVIKYGQMRMCVLKDHVCLDICSLTELVIEGKKANKIEVSLQSG